MRTGVLVKITKHMGLLAMVKEVGYDFVLLDNEHGFYSLQELHDLCMYAGAIGLETVVRISEISKTEICKTLDAGANGILVPMVEQEEQVKEIVRWAKYPPLGHRGYSGGAHTSYSKATAHREVIEGANAGRRVYIQIETAAGVQNAREILSQSCLNGVVIGPADLAISLGRPGEMDHEEHMAIMRTIAGLCRDRGIDFGIIGKESLIRRLQGEVGLAVAAIDSDLLYQGLQRQFQAVQS